MEVRLPPGKGRVTPSSSILILFAFSPFPNISLILSLDYRRCSSIPFISLRCFFLSSRPSLFPNVRPLSLRLRVSSHPLSLSLHPRTLSFPLSPLPCRPREEVHFREKKGKRREKSMRDVDWPHTAGLVPTFVRGALMGVA